MKKNIPGAVCQGTLKIGNREIDCAVLDNGTRILSRNAIYRAFKRTKRGRAKSERRVPNMPSFIDANNLQPFIDDDLRGELMQIEYKNKSGRVVRGYNATILPSLCDVYLSARSDGILAKQQLPIATQAEILVRGFARIGIIALVDEATGYQALRTRKALEEILDQFIAKELRKWAQTFPDDFYKEMFRLRNWQYIPFSVKRPSVVGHYTNDLVYERLAPGVLRELRRKNPVLPKGYRKDRHHQWLTEHIGHPKLREHIAAVIALMKASTKWDQFYRSMQRVFPKYGEQLLLPIPDGEEG
jgi:hypothetical protein